MRHPAVGVPLRPVAVLRRPAVAVPLRPADEELRHPAVAALRRRGVAVPRPPARKRQGRAPRFAIVTPSFNQAQFIGATIDSVTSDEAYTHCSTLRTTEEILGLPSLGCAATARSFAYGFGF